MASLSVRRAQLTRRMPARAERDLLEVKAAVNRDDGAGDIGAGGAGALCYKKPLLHKPGTCNNFIGCLPVGADLSAIGLCRQHRYQG